MPFSTHSLADEVAAALRKRILSGTIKPEQRLSGQNELATEFGVSVVVVREALSRLKADGLVRSRQGSGVFAVTHPTAARSFKVEGSEALSPAAMTDVLEIRLALESDAAELAARRHKSSEIKRCDVAYQKLREKFDNGEPTIDADFDFHRAIAQASGNPLFAQLLNYLHRVLLDTMHATVSRSKRSDATLARANAEHAEILAAIKAGDGKRAQRVMKRHLNFAANRLGLTLSKR